MLFIFSVFLNFVRFLLFFFYCMVGVGSLDVGYVISIFVLVSKISLLLIVVLMILEGLREVIFLLE